MNAASTHTGSGALRAGTIIRAQAHPNIALVKYWGKRDSVLNLPAVDSVSITLDTLQTTTAVELTNATDDVMQLNDRSATTGEMERLVRLADIFREHAQSDLRVRVNSHNNFPTAAGLASSASGYAALVLGLNEVYRTGLSQSRLSALARLGSGSAARSLFGGFARMHKGTRDDGKDAVATSVLDRHAWPLEVVIAITSEQAKSVSSTIGMESTRQTSPFYEQWIETQNIDIDRALQAIESRDFAALASVSEFSCLKMHGLMLSAQPGLVYWNAATVDCMHAVRRLRDEGVNVFFTIDAGPQVKAVCAPGESSRVAAVLNAIDGVSRVITTGLGAHAQRVDGSSATRAE